MYKSVFRLLALAGLSFSLWADSTAVDGASSMFGLWSGRGGGFGYFFFAPTPPPPPPPTPDPTPTIVTVAPIVNNTPPVTTGTTSTVEVNGSYNSTLYGTGLSYSTNNYGAGSFSGNPVSLNSASSFGYNNYLSSAPTGGTLTDATLNLALIIGAATGQILNGSGTANLTGDMSGLTVTISAGGVSKTVTGTNLTAYDLFANGFSSALLAGAPLTLSFSTTDTVGGTVNAASAMGASSFGMGFGRGSGFFFMPTNSNTTTNLSDTRTITGSDVTNFLTLVYTSPNNTNPVVIPFTGQVNDPNINSQDSSPEPMSMGLVAGGLGLIFYWRRKRRAA
jgi:hypothetical protein